VKRCGALHAKRQLKKAEYEDSICNFCNSDTSEVCPSERDSFLLYIGEKQKVYTCKSIEDLEKYLGDLETAQTFIDNIIKYIETL
jgi:hypothetical protein